MKPGQHGVQLLWKKTRHWLLIVLFSGCFLISATPVWATKGDTPWNFLFTLQFLENHRSEIIQAILKLLAYRDNVLMNSERYHRMIVMRPRETASTSPIRRLSRPLWGIPQPTCPVTPSPPFIHGNPLIIRSLGEGSDPLHQHFQQLHIQQPHIQQQPAGGPMGSSQDDIGEMFFESGLETYPSRPPSQPSSQPPSQPPSRAESGREMELRFFIEQGYADEEEPQDNPVKQEGVQTEPSDSLTVSPLGRSPVRLARINTGELYDQNEARRRARARRRRTPSEFGASESVDSDDGVRGWFIRGKVYDCTRVDLFNRGKFGSAYKDYAHRRRFYPTSPEPSDRVADFAEVFIRVIDEPAPAPGTTDRAYIHNDMLCIVTAENDMFFELCVKFSRYPNLSLLQLASDNYTPLVSTDSQQMDYEQKIDRFLNAFESVAQSALFNECDQQMIEVPSHGIVLVNCVGRGQCKAVLEFPELFPGLVFSWQRGHSLESAQLLDGLQGASLTVYEEIAKGLDPKSQALIDSDQIQKAPHKSIESTRMPSVYRIFSNAGWRNHCCRNTAQDSADQPGSDLYQTSFDSRSGS